MIIKSTLDLLLRINFWIVTQLVLGYVSFQQCRSWNEGSGLFHHASLRSFFFKKLVSIAIVRIGLLSFNWQSALCHTDIRHVISNPFISW